MSSSPESIPPGWEEAEAEAEAITSSPETLPPGFENPSSLSTPSSPQQENQVNLTHLSPSPSLNPLQEIQNSPQETAISLSSSFPSPNEKHDGNLGPLNPPLSQPLPEMGQMVCGSCNELLCYPRGSKYVQCACCQTTNFVLEAHQVGIVKCGKCSVLLMYPYTSKSLRCSLCEYVTEIGTHNIRPPVSVLQGFPPP